MKKVVEMELVVGLPVTLRLGRHGGTQSGAGKPLLLEAEDLFLNPSNLSQILELLFTAFISTQEQCEIR
jgi:hypothetical protein